MTSVLMSDIDSDIDSDVVVIVQIDTRRYQFERLSPCDVLRKGY